MSDEAAVTPSVLVLAGHDRSGGAGLLADMDALRTADVTGISIRTADTDQDQFGVRAVRPSSVREMERAARRELEDGNVGALKFGLLPTAEHIEAAARLARRAREAGVRWIVLDPVLSPSRGSRFHGPEGVGLMLEHLGPVGCVWTPNVPELAELAGVKTAPLEQDLRARAAAAQRVLAAGARAVVATGGHGIEDPLVDLCLEPGVEPIRIERRRLQGQGIRGSGCRFASRLAGELVKGRSAAAASEEAGAYLAELILRAGPPARRP